MLDFETLQGLLLDVAQAQAVDEALTRIVDGLAAQPGIALARVWLLRECGACGDCPAGGEQDECLQLVASQGRSRLPNGPVWNRIDGRFRRFQLNHRKIGYIGATGKPVLVADLSQDSSWLLDPAWAERERLRSFAGHALVFRGRVLGVLAMFSREPLTEDEFRWLQMFASQAAAGIKSAEAFEAVERLRRKAEAEKEYLRAEFRESQHCGEFVGSSDALRRVVHQIEVVAPTNAAVMVEGESGVGKELVARAIHDRSGRRDRPLVKVNCAAVPRDLFESEFFGHLKGAFTGAVRDRSGRFELADGGTLFLDEVGEIPAFLQSKLLRVLQEGQFERVGDDRTRTVDVRIVAATNRDLRNAVDAGEFRQDLYYRLSVFPIRVPPLRERPGDIVPLAQHFLEEACRRIGVAKPALTGAHLDQLQAYDWPGNVRELQNVIERAVITGRGGPLQFDLGGHSGAVPAAIGADEPERVLTYDELRDFERRNVLGALHAADWQVSGDTGAAAMLGIPPTTLASKMKAMKIRRPAPHER